MATILARDTAEERRREESAETEEREAEREHQRLLCAACGHAITSREHRIESNGAHRHTCTNPHGLVFDIGCFSEAPGCVGIGPATYEWTWFPGFAWQVALCAHCHTHLGWSYRSEGGEGFYGLILGRLVEPS